MGNNIEIFISRLDNYFKLCSNLNDELKIAILLQQFDESAFQIFQHAVIPDVDKLNYDRYIVHVRDRFGAKESEQELRLNFRSTRQSSTQSFDEYYESLVRMAQKAFPRQNADVIDGQLTDQFVQGLHNSNVRVRLIEQAPRDSQEALTFAKRFHAAQTYASRCESPETEVKVRAAPVSYRRPGRPWRSNAMRTSDGKPICWLCGKIGHMSYRCRGSSRNPGRYPSRGSSPERQQSYRESSSNRERSNSQSSQSSRGTASPNRERQEQQTAQYGPRGHGQGVKRSNSPAAPRGHGRGFQRKPVSTVTAANQVTHQFSSLAIQGSIDGYRVNFFVDSGSSISLMSHKCFKELQQAEKCLKLNKTNTVALSVNEDKLEILGTIDITFELYGTTRIDSCTELAHTFYVAKNIMYDCLLGLDFMQTYNVVLDVVKKTALIKLNDKVMSHKMIELSDDMLTSSVFVPTDVFIDKRSQRVFVAKLTMVEGNGGETHDGVASDTSGMEGIFTPDSAVEDKHQMLGASVLSRVTDGHILVQMMNVTNDPIIIKEGTCIGSFEWLGVSNEDECDDMSDETYDNDYDTRHCKRVSSTLNVPFNSKRSRITLSQQKKLLAMRCKHRVASAKSKERRVSFVTATKDHANQVSMLGDVLGDDYSQSFELESPIRYLMDARKRLREVFNQVNEALKVERHHYKKVKDKQGSNLLTLKPSYTAKSPVPKRRRIKHSSTDKTVESDNATTDLSEDEESGSDTDNEDDAPTINLAVPPRAKITAPAPAPAPAAKDADKVNDKATAAAAAPDMETDVQEAAAQQADKDKDNDEKPPSPATRYPKRDRRPPQRYEAAQAVRAFKFNLLSLTNLMMIMILALALTHTTTCMKTKQLSSQLGTAYLCSVGNDGVLFSMGEEPSCEVKNYINEQVHNIIVRPYFIRTISPIFKIWSCSIQRESVTTFTSFFCRKRYNSAHSSLLPI